jgi:hypothetical protein
VEPLYNAPQKNLQEIGWPAFKGHKPVIIPGGGES